MGFYFFFKEDKQGKKKEHSEAHMTPCKPAGSLGKAAHNNRSNISTLNNSPLFACH